MLTLLPGHGLSDLYGNSNVESRTVTVVDNMEPTFVLPSDITVDCEDAGDLTLTGSPGSVADNCDPNPLIYYSDIFTSGNCPSCLYHFKDLVC